MNSLSTAHRHTRDLQTIEGCEFYRELWVGQVLLPASATAPPNMSSDRDGAETFVAKSALPVGS